MEAFIAPILEPLMLLGIGLLIGLVLGLTGAGGSVFAVPLLMLLAGLPMSDAVGISLGAVAASTLFGSLRNGLQRQDKRPILWLPGAILAGAGAITAPLGKWLSMQLPETALLIAFSLLASIIAMRMWWQAQHNPVNAGVVRAANFTQTERPELLCNLSPSGQFELRLRCMSGLIIGGALVGLLSGLFGVGGGFLIVPLLLALSAVSMSQAVSTSLIIIAFISGTGFSSHLLLNPNNDWQLLALVATGGILGMVFGQLISHKIANALLQKVFALSLLAVALLTLITHTI